MSLSLSGLLASTVLLLAFFILCVRVAPDVVFVNIVDIDGDGGNGTSAFQYRLLFLRLCGLGDDFCVCASGCRPVHFRWHGVLLVVGPA